MYIDKITRQDKGAYLATGFQIDAYTGKEVPLEMTLTEKELPHYIANYGSDDLALLWEVTLNVRPKAKYEVEAEVAA